MDYFPNIPLDIKLAIFEELGHVKPICILSIACKEWHKTFSSDALWKNLFLWHFLSHNKQLLESIELEPGETWKSRYAQYYIRGWQWDKKKCSSSVVISNNGFTVDLPLAVGYKGCRTTREVSSGKHYFEVMIEQHHDEAVNISFNKGTRIFVGVGITNSKFNVENGGSGWSVQSDGVGYWNDGQLYFHGTRLRTVPFSKFLVGDRVGFELDLDNGTICFYINGEPQTNVISGIPQNTYCPTVIFTQSGKNRITITSSKLGGTVPPSLSFPTPSPPPSSDPPPPTPPPVTPTPPVPEVPPEEKFERQLSEMIAMGFDKQKSLNLLTKHNGNLELAVNEMLIDIS